MLTNLFTSLVIAFGVGVSSVNMDHNINSKVDDINSSYNDEVIYSYSNCERFYYSHNRFNLRSLDYSSDYTKYQVPSFLDISNLYGTIGYSRGAYVYFKQTNSNTYDYLKVYFDFASSDYALMVELANGSRVPIYTLTQTYVYEYSGFFEGLELQGNIYPSYDISQSYFVKEEGNSYNATKGLLLFYFSKYSFSGSKVYTEKINPMLLFFDSNELSNDYTTKINTWDSEVNPVLKYAYKGWFSFNGAYYNQIRVSLCNSSNINYIGHLAKTDGTTEERLTYVGNAYFLWSLTFYNSIDSSGFVAYAPIFGTWIDSNGVSHEIYYPEANGWNVPYIDFISMSTESSNEQLKTSFVPFGWYLPYQQLSLEYYPTDSDSNWLTSTMRLVAYAFIGLRAFLDIKILPFVSLGTLLFLPLMFVIVFAVVKLFKR